MAPAPFQSSGQFYLSQSSSSIASIVQLLYTWCLSPSHTSHCSSVIFISELEHFCNFLIVYLPTVRHISNLTFRHPPHLSPKEPESPIPICKILQWFSIVLRGKNNSSLPWYKTLCAAIILTFSLTLVAGLTTCHYFLLFEVSRALFQMTSQSELIFLTFLPRPRLNYNLLSENFGNSVSKLRAAWERWFEPLLNSLFHLALHLLSSLIHFFTRYEGPWGYKLSQLNNSHWPIHPMSQI